MGTEAISPKEIASVPIFLPSHFFTAPLFTLPAGRDQ